MSMAARRLLLVLLLLPFVRGGEPAPSTEEPARAAHLMLTRLCDDFGGRVTGTAASRGAQERLTAELRTLGLRVERVPFKMPGWERGVDRVELVAPFRRALRVAALAYTQPLVATEAEVVDIAGGRPENYPADARGKVGLLAPDAALAAREFVATAAAHGLVGVLFTNRVDGGQLLARTGSFLGEPLSLPVLSLAQEEGRWLRRLLARGTPVRVRLETTSRCREIEAANLVLRLPGRSADRVIVGAHLDSWDLGQGATDNGLGVAQLFAMAHAWRGRDLPRTVEFVWFDAEELGLQGSRHQAALLGDAPVVAMVNLDMVGVPEAVNVFGEDTLVPALERWHAVRTPRLAKGVVSNLYFGSDHMPYLLAGVRTMSFNGVIDRAVVRYYHDFADTIEKLPESLVVDSTAIIADAVWALIHDPALPAWRRPAAETEKILRRFGIDKRMQAVGWPAAP
jgi:Iap family predicted aminopeptidase